MYKTILLILTIMCVAAIGKAMEPFEAMDTLQTGYIKVLAGNDGRFTIGTADGKRLLFGFPSEGSTSHTFARIDGVSYHFGNFDGYMDGTITNALHKEGNSLVMTWTYADVDITQRLTVVEGASTGNDDTILIEYIFTNNSSSSHEIGLLLEMDTMIGWNDAAKISTSFGYTGYEQDFNADSTGIPQYWQAFEQSPTQPESLLVGQGTLTGGYAVMPDRFCLGPWGTYDDVTWEYASSGYNYYDSAVLLWWYPVSLAPDATHRVATLYGLGAGSIVTGELALNITAPLTLTVGSGGEYSPNPFDVNVLVTNTTAAEITDISATIDLPAGLHLAAGETATKSVNPANLGAGLTGNVSWSVVAETQTTEQVLTYSVTANGGSYSNDVERNITIPATTTTSDIRSVKLTITSVNTSDFPNIKAYCAVVDSITNPLVAITGLGETNFTVSENSTSVSSFDLTFGGAERRARSFDDEEGPIDVALVGDVSSYMSEYDSARAELTNLFVSASDTIDREMRFSLISFTDHIEEMYDFTESSDELLGWIETAFEPRSNSPTETNGLEAISRIADFNWSDEAIRLMLFTTAGPFETGGAYTTMGIVDMLRSLSITALVFGVDDPDQHMLADSTNGMWLPVQFLNMIADSLAADLIGGDVGQYIISYTSPNPNPDGSWRDLEITVTVQDTFTDDDESGYYAPSTSGLYFYPETTHTRNGYSFAVDVKAASMVNLNDVHFKVNFDPAKVRYDSTKVGKLLARDASSPLTVISTETGIIDISLTRTGTTTGVTGSGVLATLYFNTVASNPTSSLSFSDVVLQDPDFVDIPTTIDTFGYIVYLSGVGSGDPGDSTDCMLCDFDCDGDIDTRDFVLLAGYWQPTNSPTGDVGPATGRAPTLDPIPDGPVNYEDLFVFGRMWNWYHLVVLGHPKVSPIPGVVSLENSSEGVSIIGSNLPPIGMAHFEIMFDPSRTQVLSVSLRDLGDGFTTTDNGVIDIAAIRLVSYGEDAEISGNASFADIRFSGENTFEFRKIDIRNGRGETVNLTRALSSNVPREFSLSTVIPNPFNPVAGFSIAMPVEDHLTVEVFDINGRKVSTIVDREFPVGIHSLEWNGYSYPSGVYYIKAVSGSNSAIRKALLLK